MCSCADWHGCIMRWSVSGEDGIQPYKFSECSVNQFKRWMDQVRHPVNWLPASRDHKRSSAAKKIYVKLPKPIKK